MALWRVNTAMGPRLALGDATEGPTELLEKDVQIDNLLKPEGVGLQDLHELPRASEQFEVTSLAAPIGSQEIWAAGVTYKRSLDARLEESHGDSVYDRVYHAERPELFLKCTPRRVEGPSGVVHIRSDSGWDVPEPELGLVIDAAGQIVGYVLGNDMSSRAIEAENPLYLAQAKIYTGSCAIGPCLVPLSESPDFHDVVIRMTIFRQREPVFDDSVAVSSMVRSAEELTAWLYSALDFPFGAVLLTGTGLVPLDDFSLEAGDIVEVTAEGLGTLTNSVALLTVRR